VNCSVTEFYNKVLHSDAFRHCRSLTFSGRIQNDGLIWPENDETQIGTTSNVYH
jgi:hypothetical protein